MLFLKRKPDNAAMYVWAAAVLLSVTLVIVRAQENSPPGRLARSLSSIPHTIQGWVSDGTQAAVHPAVVRRLNATEYLQRTYLRDGQYVELWISFHGQQRAGEGIHSPRNCLPGAGWEFARLETADIRTGDGSARINKHTVQKGGERRIVLYWYQNERRVVANEYVAKAYQVWDSLTTGRTSASLVRITTYDNPAAVAAATEFASTIVAALRTCFPAGAEIRTTQLHSAGF